MGDTNICVVEGEVVSDPKIDYVGESGVAKCFFMVKNTRGFNGKSRANYVPCNMWGTKGEEIAKRLHKGQHVVVSGEIEVRKWKNNDDEWQERFAVRGTEVSVEGEDVPTAAPASEAPATDNPFATDTPAAEKPATAVQEPSKEDLEDW
jgi:single-strand DNA-binding protein